MNSIWLLYGQKQAFFEGFDWIGSGERGRGRVREREGGRGREREGRIERGEGRCNLHLDSPIFTYTPGNRRNICRKFIYNLQANLVIKFTYNECINAISFKKKKFYFLPYWKFAGEIAHSQPKLFRRLPVCLLDSDA